MPIVIPKWKCISIDPPWNERGGGRIKRGADRWYETLPTHEIIRVILSSRLWNPADNSHLWLWVTNNFLAKGDGHLVMKALGYRCVNKITWGKVTEDETEDEEGRIIIKPRVQKGIGQYFFGSDEVLLFGVRGRLKRLDRVPTLGLAPRTPKHSEKPDMFYDMMETVSPGPRLEMFGRKDRPGWRVWGHGRLSGRTKEFYTGREAA